MSQTQRPSAANGVGRRRNEKEVSRSDNQNWRQPARTTSNSSTQGVLNHVTTGDGGPRSGESMITRGGERTLNERLLFMHTCLIGQQVEVQTKNGMVYSGIFHASNTEKAQEFGVVLRMARLVKDGAKGAKSDLVRDAAKKPPIKTHTIHGKDFVQIIAKDVSLSGDALPNGRTRENRAEIITDAVLSQGRHRELERELKPWKPDEETPENLNLSFSNSWSSRNWDQFETNKALFGVETTFNEELYTTKLERGPQMREREREAYRIAREIEGQQTRNPHLAEERGVRAAPEVEAMDEESRYSSVLRGEKDIGEDDEDHHIDDRNDETFGGSFDRPSGSGSGDSNSSTPLAGEADNKGSRPSSADSTHTVNGATKRETLQDRRASSIEKGDVASLESSADTHREHLRLRTLLVGDRSKRSNKGPGSPYHSPVARNSPLMSPLVGDSAGFQALNLDTSCPTVPPEVVRLFENFKQQETKKGKKKTLEELKAFSESFKKKDLEPRSPKAAPKGVPGDVSREGSTRPGPVNDVKSSLAPSVPTALQNTVQALAPSPSALPLPVGLGTQAKQPSGVESSATAGVSTSGASLPQTQMFNSQAPATTGLNQGMASPSLSRSSSTTSLASATGSSKKSTLNANAKEFKLNPNAPSFTPSFSSPRPASPVVQSSPVYMHASLPPPTPIQGVPVGIQYMQSQQNQPGQFPQFNNSVVPASPVASSTQFMPSPGFVPAYTGGGVSGGGVLQPGQPSMKVPPHSQQQVVNLYGQQQQQQQQLRYPHQPPPMQPAFMHHNQLYQQPMMFQPGAQVMYIQPFPQGMMQGQPVPPPQGHLPPPQLSQQNQPQKHRSGAIQAMHFGSAPSFLPGQQHHLQPPPMSHLHSDPSAGRH